MSQAARPASKFQGITNQLGEYIRSGSQPTQWEAAAMSRDARSLLSTGHPEEGWTALVGIAAAQWRVDEVRSLASDAVSRIGPLPFLLSNLAVAFRTLSLVDEALEYIKRAYQADPANWELVEPYASDLGNTGCFTQAADVLRTFSARVGSNVKDYPFAASYLALIEDSIADLKKSEVPELQLQSELREAYAVLHLHQMRCGTVSYIAQQQPEGETLFSVRLGFLGNFESELALGSALAQRLALLHLWDPTRLLIDFEARSEIDAIHAGADALITPA